MAALDLSATEAATPNLNAAGAAIPDHRAAEATMADPSADEAATPDLSVIEVVMLDHRVTEAAAPDPSGADRAVRGLSANAATTPHVSKTVNAMELYGSMSIETRRPTATAMARALVRTGREPAFLARSRSRPG